MKINPLQWEQEDAARRVEDDAQKALRAMRVLGLAMFSGDPDVIASVGDAIRPVAQAMAQRHYQADASGSPTGQMMLAREAVLLDQAEAAIPAWAVVDANGVPIGTGGGIGGVDCGHCPTPQIAYDAACFLKANGVACDMVRREDEGAFGKPLPSKDPPAPKIIRGVG